MKILKDRWNGWQEKYPFRIILFLIVSIGGVTFCINNFPLFYNFMASCTPGNAYEEISSWFSFVSGAAAASVAFIAYKKFEDFNKQNRTDFLFRIDERWGSPEAIKARIIIHELYMQIQKKHKKEIDILSSKCRDASIQEKMGDAIIQLRKTKKKESDFIYLLNFLDFMETIGYIESKENVTVDELEALCGESLLFNYRIFKPYIEEKRARHQNEEFYTHFESLYKKLKEKPKTPISIRKT